MAVEQEREGALLCYPIRHEIIDKFILDFLELAEPTKSKGLTAQFICDVLFSKQNLSASFSLTTWTDSQRKVMSSLLKRKLTELVSPSLLTTMRLCRVIGFIQVGARIWMLREIVVGIRFRFLQWPGSEETLT